MPIEAVPEVCDDRSRHIELGLRHSLRRPGSDRARILADPQQIESHFRYVDLVLVDETPINETWIP